MWRQVLEWSATPRAQLVSACRGGVAPVAAGEPGRHAGYAAGASVHCPRDGLRQRIGDLRGGAWVGIPAPRRRTVRPRLPGTARTPGTTRLPGIARLPGTARIP